MYSRTIRVQYRSGNELLLEVISEREVQKRPARRRELHRRGQPTLDDRQVAAREVPIEIVDVAANLEACVGG